MKNLKSVLIGLLIFVSSLSFGQVKITTTTGVATTFLPNSLGFQVGVNPSFEIVEYFSFEGQVSYIHVNGTRFLSGEEVTRKSLNALAGGRLYLQSRKESYRTYINLLAGVNHSSDANSELGFGLSLGIYGELNDKFLAGIAVETYSFYLAKVGYQF